MSYELREYQEGAIAETKRLLREGKRRPLIVCPTGGGKTLIAVKGIILPAVAKGSVVWFVAPRKQLVHQTSTKLDEIGLTDHGVVMANHWRKRPLAPVQVCSKDTLRNRHDLMARPNIVIWDEAHHVTDKNGCGAIVTATNAIHIGLTATPCRLDGKGLGSIFDCMIQVSTIADLISMGFLIPPRVFRAKGGVDLSGVKMSHGDFNQKDLAAASDKPKLVGNIVAQWQRDGDNRPTVCFAVNVAHSLHIVEQFKAAGVPAGHIDANTPDNERQHLLRLLRSGAIKVMSSVGVFTEGFDMPCVGCVILARATASLSLFIQMAGRGLRPEFGTAREGEHCIFLDHAGLTARFGPITQVREWSLEDGAKKEAKPFRYQCRECGEELKGRPEVCPHCGADLRTETSTTEIPEGDDTLLEEAEQAPIVPLSERQEYYRKLEEIGFTHNWAPVMVGAKFRDKYGNWPSKTERATSQQRIAIVKNKLTGKWAPVWKDIAKEAELA